MQNLAVGNGFSVGSMPGMDSLMQGGVPNFGTGNTDIAEFCDAIPERFEAGAIADRQGKLDLRR